MKKETPKQRAKKMSDDEIIECLTGHITDTLPIALWNEFLNRFSHLEALYDIACEELSADYE